MTSPCILLIDDHTILLDGLRMVLEARLEGVRVVATASLGGAMQYDGVPDAIVLDIHLPGINGLEGIALLQRKWPQARVVLLSSQDDTETRQQALARGAVAFVSKAESGERIVQVICGLLHGELPAPQLDAVATPPQYLTPRQCEVLDLLCQGLPNKTIAKKLYLSDNTVRRHVQDIFAFFGVSNRTEAVLAAKQKGIMR